VATPAELLALVGLGEHAAWGAGAPPSPAAPGQKLLEAWPDALAMRRA